MTNEQEQTGTDEVVQDPTDMAGFAFKVVLLALALGIAYFLVKPLWDDLFRTLPTTPQPNIEKKDVQVDRDEWIGS